MSVRVQTYVWQLQLTPTQKLVAIALADHCHDDGSEARPSQTLLMKKTGLSERTVRSTLGQLVEAGVIMLERSYSQHRPNCYYFPIPEGFATLRGATPAPLPPEGQSTSQRGNSRRSEGQQLPPNHKEPSYEPKREKIEIVDMEKVRAKNDQIFRRNVKTLASSAQTN